MKAIFVGPQGIRAGWRFATFVFLLFGFSKLFFWLLTVLFHYQEHVGWFPTDFLLDGLLSFGAALLAAWIMSRIERRPFHEYGLSWNTMFGKHFWQGVLWGFAASLLMVILLGLFGAASFEGLALHGQAFLKSALLWAAAFLLLGFAEEFAYRGYSQVTLAEGMGFWRAALLLSAIFGAVHYFFKPLENWMDGLSVGLFGLFGVSRCGARGLCGSPLVSMRCLTTQTWSCSLSPTQGITGRASLDTCSTFPIMGPSGLQVARVERRRVDWNL